MGDIVRQGDTKSVYSLVPLPSHVCSDMMSHCRMYKKAGEQKSPLDSYLLPRYNPSIIILLHTYKGIVIDSWMPD